MYTFLPAVIGVTIPTRGGLCEQGMDVVLSVYIGCIYEFVSYLAVGLAILMLIYAGYKYMSSQGNPDALTEAKDIIFGTIISLLVLGLGYLILSSISGNLVQ
ncbi:MAG TPA: hypothetical protein VJJ80_02150 [Patescibacteria group bacterium]|nr:hypothetical protein [Patescibacteria group bacterium]